MNRYKKEEKKRGKPFPTLRLSGKEFNEMMSYYDRTTQYQRMRETLARSLRYISDLAKKLRVRNG